MTDIESKIINEKEIRVFSNAALQASVERVLATLPDDATGAVVAHGDLNGASLSIVGKVNDHWTIVAAAYKPWKGALSAEADVKYAW